MKTTIGDRVRIMRRQWSHLGRRWLTAPLAGCILGVLALGTLLTDAGAQFIDFEADTTGSKPNGFTSTGFPGVSFSDSLGADLEINNFGTQGNGQSLAVNGDDASQLIFNFTAPVTLLRLAFGNDDPSYSAAGDLAILTGFLSGVQVIQDTLLLNRNDIMDQIVTITGVSFDSASFYYGNPALVPINLIEIVDSLQVDPLPPAPSDLGKDDPATGFREDEGRAVLLADFGAINSLLGTGLLIPQVHRSVLQNAASNATRDLNSRLFRARTLEETVREKNELLIQITPRLVRDFESSMDTSTLRYLNFAANQNIDYRVALGLREGVEVEYRDDSMALGDTFWATSPFALSGGPVILGAAPHFTGAVIAAPAGATSGGKETFEDKVVMGEPAGKRWETFAEFDYGFYDQDTLTNLVRGFDSDLYAGSVGVEYRVFPWLHAGLALTKLESDTEISSNLGGIDLDGTVLSGYFTAFHKRTYLDVLYSYGAFDSDISRNTLLGSTAHGDAESFSHNIDINVGHNYALSDQIVAGPYAGFNYSNGGVDGYTETGGGSANIVYPADDFESMIGRLGWQLAYTTETPVGRLTAQGRAAWAHQFMPESDTVQASLATSPFILVSGNHAARVGGFGAAGDGAHAGTDWLELGAGLRLHLDESWNVQLDYEGQFARNNASAHFAAVKLEYEWDDVFLPGLGGGKGVVADSGGAPKAKGAGWKGLFAGKSASAAPVAAEDRVPFAEAKPAVPRQGLGEGPMTPAALPVSGGSSADKPKIYTSWKEVPGREEVKATPPAAVASVATSLPKEAAAEAPNSEAPAKGEKAEAKPAEISTGAVTTTATN